MLGYRVREQKVVFQTILSRLEDWIVFGTKKETDLTYATVKALKTAISENRSCTFTVPTSEPISLTYQSLVFSQTLTLIPPEGEEERPLTASQAKQLYEEFRGLQTGRKIKYGLFKEFLAGRLTSRGRSWQYPLSLRGQTEFPLVEQCLVEGGSLFFNELVLTVLLPRSKVPFLDQVEDYEARLTRQGTVSTLSLLDFLAVEAPFDAAEGDWATEAKKLLFEVFMDSFKGEIELAGLLAVLRIYNQLQVERFWSVLATR